MSGGVSIPKKKSGFRCRLGKLNSASHQVIFFFRLSITIGVWVGIGVRVKVRDGIRFGSGVDYRYCKLNSAPHQVDFFFRLRITIGVNRVWVGVGVRVRVRRVGIRFLTQALLIQTLTLT